MTAYQPGPRHARPLEEKTKDPGVKPGQKDLGSSVIKAAVSPNHYKKFPLDLEITDVFLTMMTAPKDLMETLRVKYGLSENELREISAQPYIGYLWSNTMKYLIRLGSKDNSVQDSQKSAWYLVELIHALDCLRQGVPITTTRQNQRGDSIPARLKEARGDNK